MMHVLACFVVCLFGPSVGSGVRPFCLVLLCLMSLVLCCLLPSCLTLIFRSVLLMLCHVLVVLCYPLLSCYGPVLLCCYLVLFWFCCGRSAVCVPGFSLFFSLLSLFPFSSPLSLFLSLSLSLFSPSCSLSEVEANEESEHLI